MFVNNIEVAVIAINGLNYVVVFLGGLGGVQCRRPKELKVHVEALSS